MIHAAGVPGRRRLVGPERRAVRARDVAEGRRCVASRHADARRGPRLLRLVLVGRRDVGRGGAKVPTPPPTPSWTASPRSAVRAVCPAQSLAWGPVGRRRDGRRSWTLRSKPAHAPGNEARSPPPEGAALLEAALERPEARSCSSRSTCEASARRSVARSRRSGGRWCAHRVARRRLAGAWAKEIAALPAARRLEAVLDAVRAEVARALSLPASTGVPADRPLQELGSRFAHGGGAAQRPRQAGGHVRCPRRSPSTIRRRARSRSTSSRSFLTTRRSRRCASRRRCAPPRRRADCDCGHRLPLPGRGEGSGVVLAAARRRRGRGDGSSARALGRRTVGTIRTRTPSGR